MLALAAKIEIDEIRVNELIDGFVEVELEDKSGLNEGEDQDEDGDEEEGEEESSDESGADDEEEDEEVMADASAAAAAADLAQLKADALARFAVIADLFNKMGKAYEKYGYLSEQYNTYQAGITEELMAFRFTAKQVDALCNTMRGLVEEIRNNERGIQDICEIGRAS